MMKKVLITRPYNQAQELEKSLQKNGFECFVEPLFVVKKLSINFDLDALQQVGGIILTSQNAIDGALEFLEKFNIDKKIKIFAVGKKTALGLIDRGYNNVILSDQTSAKNLLEKIIHDQKSSTKKLLYFCGNSITLDFVKELESFDIKAQKIVCYEVIMNKNFSAELLAKVKETKFDYVLLYSQNSAKNFFSLAKKHNLLEYFQSSQIVCLSEKILLLAQQLGFKNSTTLNKFYE